MHACSTIKRFCLTIALLGIPQRLSWPVFPQRRLLCARCWRQVSAEEATKPRTDSPSPKQTPKHVLVKCPKPQNASCATCPRQVSAEGGEAHDNQILGTCGRLATLSQHEPSIARLLVTTSCSRTLLAYHLYLLFLGCRYLSRYLSKSARMCLRRSS